jgi:ATP-dependent protease HslVU (ClpYQ) peptidase subunit
LSCIATLRHKNTIYMACDSAWTFFPEGAVTVASDPKKVILVGVDDNSDAQILIGVVGPGECLCTLHDELNETSLCFPTFEHVRTRIDKILTEADDKLWEKFEKGADPCSVLVAIGDKLYRIVSKHAWIEVCDPIYAVGSGADVALGALHALTKRKSEDAFEVRSEDEIALWLAVALEAAETYDTSVKRPFCLFQTVKLSDEEK